jgi:hypothetical protein
VAPAVADDVGDGGLGREVREEGADAADGEEPAAGGVDAPAVAVVDGVETLEVGLDRAGLLAEEPEEA